MIDYPGVVDGAILVGTGFISKMKHKLAMFVVGMESKKYGDNVATERVRELSFGTYNKKFKPNQTDYDWLCSSIESLHDYMNDPMCKKDISAGLFYDLLASMKKTGLKDAYNNELKKEVQKQS